ncbi:rCG63589 [Rattus norvegicus]|uniref:RCG63589 n=1 Tax=Rattus norvegicus TaxID=10116 RepID=A6I527_RAT|nr:rCG63589 [Rattus norvegicus]
MGYTRLGEIYRTLKETFPMEDTICAVLRQSPRGWHHSKTLVDSFI